MQRTLSILLLSITLMGSILDLQNLPKVARLVEHYIEHHKSTPEVSFLAYIKLHYGSESGRHEHKDKTKHAGLPFKAHDYTSSHFAFVLAEFTHISPVHISKEEFHPNLYQSAFFHNFIQSIWQPPKFGVLIF